ncbi:MAG: HNH endonuclease [Herbiconiux sp.]|uniref:HNH endonuclease n=1 Tax=Herbiconiux sp. TaxID=1871186 RepID=UPI001213DCD8|nr:MAG: HNH endonuclease [Herbiconiux sp.]
MSSGRNTTQRNRDRYRIRATHAACGICGDTIDYTLPHTDPRSFVVDHVIPLAKGGPDRIENKQAAHRDCNSTKRARIIAPIVKRSGSLH